MNSDGKSDVFDEQDFIRYCEILGLRCHCSEGIAFVSSLWGNWRILHDGCLVEKLQHENYDVESRSKMGRGKFYVGFHTQELKNKNIYSVVEYIACHDNKRGRMIANCMF